MEACDGWAESSFYMVGTIDEVRDKEQPSHGKPRPS